MRYFCNALLPSLDFRVVLEPRVPDRVVNRVPGYPLINGHCIFNAEKFALSVVAYRPIEPITASVFIAMRWPYKLS
jgi:hypothetical protein